MISLLTYIFYEANIITLCGLRLPKATANHTACWQVIIIDYRMKNANYLIAIVAAFTISFRPRVLAKRARPVKIKKVVSH